MSAQTELTNPKISVYIALGMVGLVTVTDLIITQTIDATKEISLALVAFAGLRQAAKTLLNK